MGLNLRVLRSGEDDDSTSLSGSMSTVDGGLLVSHGLVYPFLDAGDFVDGLRKAGDAAAVTETWGDGGTEAAGGGPLSRLFFFFFGMIDGWSCWSWSITGGSRKWQARAVDVARDPTSTSRVSLATETRMMMVLVVAQPTESNTSSLGGAKMMWM